MFCTKCGYKNIAEALYCQECGTSLAHKIEPLLTTDDCKRQKELAELNKPQVAIGSGQEQNSGQEPWPKSVQHSNFIVKHWNGNYSLGISYWIIGCLLSAPLNIFIRILEENGGAEGAGYLMTGAVIIIMAIWQTVGIWKSASKHVGRGGKKFWAITVKIVVAFQIIFGFLLPLG